MTFKADLNRKKEIEPSKHVGEGHSKQKEYIQKVRKEARDRIILDLTGCGKILDFIPNMMKAIGRF